MRIGTINRNILHIALPAIVSNVTVPLLGMVDTAIVGHLGNSSFIGAIAIGGLIFNIVYWLFGFLRAGTSGPTAQAYGEDNGEKIKANFYRSVTFAVIIAVLLIILQKELMCGAFFLIAPSPQVEHWAQIYYNICIWGVPAVMLTIAFSGWFIGLQNTRATMTIAVVQNIVNVPASLFFVFILGMKVEGVALGTVVAQYTGLMTAWVFRRMKYRKYCSRPKGISVFSVAAIRRFFNINRDIFLRTLCLVTVTAFFTSYGARQGDRILAANTILLQLFYLFSYVMDGFANAGEALSGRFYGACDRKSFVSVVHNLFYWGIVLVLLFTFAYFIGGKAFLGLFSNDEIVIIEAMTYFPWALLIPVAGMVAFLWDGIFIGTTSTLSMLLSALIATIVFFGGWGLLHATWGNHGLWFAFILYLAVRGGVQTLLYPLIRKKVFLSI